MYYEKKKIESTKVKAFLIFERAGNLLSDFIIHVYF